MIFLDTSAIYALADANDLHHSEASEMFALAFSNNEDILLHNYLLIESTALLRRRLGLDVALRFLDQMISIQTHWIDNEDHAQAVTLLRERDNRGLSLVDCASFVVMRRYGIMQAMAFDVDFEHEGFSIYSGN